MAALMSIIGGRRGRVLESAEGTGLGGGSASSWLHWADRGRGGRGPVDTPSSFMNQAVMVPAEHDQVVEAGGTALGPGDEMVDVTPGRRPVASREDAVQVTGDDGDPEGGCDQSLGPSHVERLAVGTKDDPGQVGITGDPRDLVCGEEGPKLCLGDTGLTFEQGLGRDMDDETGPPGAAFDHLHEEVGPSGCVGSCVIRARGTWVESGCKSFPGFNVDPAVDPHHVVITPEIQCSGLPDQLASGRGSSRAT